MAYTEAEKTKALTLLYANGYNYEKTAEITGITKMTLYNWEKEGGIQKKGIPEMLEDAIIAMLSMMPDKWNGNSWSVALGIMMDKYLLMRGEATSRSETVTTKIQGLAESMEPEMREQILAEATKIIENASAKKETE